MNRRGFPELVADDVVHAFDLLLDACRQLAGTLLGQDCSDRGQRRLQAVCQVVERVSITLRATAFAADQQIHVARHARQLVGKIVRKRFPAAALDLADFRFNLAQRFQQAPHHRGNQQQHDQRYSPEPGEKLLPEALDLRIEGIEALRDAEGIWLELAVVEFPLYVQAERHQRGPVGQLDPGKTVASRRRARAAGHVETERRTRNPDGRLRFVVQGAVQARSEVAETRLAEIDRHLEFAADVGFGLGYQRHQLAVQDISLRLFACLAEGAVQDDDRCAEEDDQQQADR